MQIPITFQVFENFQMKLIAKQINIRRLRNFWSSELFFFFSVNIVPSFIIFLTLKCSIELLQVK